MAEGVLRAEAEKRGLAIEIDSAGTANHHTGEAPDPRAIACMRSYGIDISLLRARQFSVQDFERFDHIFVMDRANLRNVMQLTESDAHRSKVKLWLHHAPTSKQEEVPDPWYGKMDGFHEVYHMIEEASQGFLESQSFPLR
jgi:protein-tyrosine phosphatase